MPKRVIPNGLKAKAIATDPRPQRTVARAYRVSPSTVGRIRRGESYTDVTGIQRP